MKKLKASSSGHLMICLYSSYETARLSPTCLPVQEVLKSINYRQLNQIAMKGMHILVYPSHIDEELLYLNRCLLNNSFQKEIFH